MKLPFDRSHRRRIYLMRHADAQYIQPDGTRAPDSRVVPLTARGIDEAGDMSRLLKDVAFDRVICSGLPRTQQTARIVMGDRNLTLEIEPALEEIRGGDPIARANLSPVDYAYAMFCASEPDACFASGEKFSDFYGRIVPAFEAITQATNWTRLLLVAHGGVNRAILSTIISGGLKCFGAFEQDSACVNIIDIDQEDGAGHILRKILRGVNITARDPIKNDRVLTTMEGMAQRFAAAGKD
jgi:probable phosphoglycerate mutase